jgi:hypothetical protein
MGGSKNKRQLETDHRSIAGLPRAVKKPPAVSLAVERRREKAVEKEPFGAGLLSPDTAWNLLDVEASVQRLLLLIVSSGKIRYLAKMEPQGRPYAAATSKAAATARRRVLK